MIRYLAGLKTFHRHTVEQRLCSVLLLASDFMRSADLRLTQEEIAETLDVRRASVTSAAGDLRQAGAIDFKRGRITIKDRPFLVECACDCYPKRNERANYESMESDRL
jgi:CRP-like cAMP-binding protein